MIEPSVPRCATEKEPQRGNVLCERACTPHLQRSNVL